MYVMFGSGHFCESVDGRLNVAAVFGGYENEILCQGILVVGPRSSFHLFQQFLSSPNPILMRVLLIRAE